MPVLNIHLHHLPDEETAERLRQIERLLLGLIEGNQKMLDLAVRALMDAAKRATTIGPAVDAGFEAVNAKVDTLTEKINSMQAGAVLTDDDQTALQQEASELNSVVDTLQTDIPAGVTDTSTGPATAA